jgi:hypothetical protein
MVTRSRLTWRKQSQKVAYASLLRTRQNPPFHTATADAGNRLVADMANAVIDVHAAAGSKLEAHSPNSSPPQAALTFDHPATLQSSRRGAVHWPTDDLVCEHN